MRQLVPLVGGALLAQACFLGTPPSPSLGPSDAPALEARIQTDSTDVAAFAALAALRLDASQYEAARALLERADRISPDDAAVRLLLAVADERQEAIGSARARYAAYRYGRIGRLADYAGARLVATRAAALRAEVTATLDGDPDPTPDAARVVVLPMAYGAELANGPALAAAVSEMASWDLSEDGLLVVSPERARILLDVLGVPPAQRAEQPVGLEIGRRLGAGTVAQGVILFSAVGLTWQGTVTTLSSTDDFDVRALSVEAGPGETLVLQRRISVELGRVLGGGQGAAPAPRFYTVSEEAMGRFGEGLLAMDAGEAAAAQASFAEAASFDPRFERASDLVDYIEPAVDAPLLDFLVFEAVRIGELQRPVDALWRAPASSRQAALAGVGRRDRAYGADLLGLDFLSGGPVAEITFTLPGSGP